MEISLFVQVALLLASALLAISALRLLNLPTIPAYFLVGVFVGPNGWEVLQSGEAVVFASELGIILLLFSIGLKFNMESLYSMRQFVFVYGGLQVLLTGGVAGAIAFWFLQDVFLASLVGFIAAMSSTAITSQILIDQHSVNTPLGWRTMGVLLFQDLLIIPLIIIYSSDSESTSLWTYIGLIVLKIAVVMGVVIYIAPFIIRAGLDWVVKRQDKELFIVSIVTLVVVASLTTGSFGLSYVLGAFLAGSLVSETFHRYRVEQIIEPFRQLFLGFFFISLGILVNPNQVVDNIGTIALLALFFLVFKVPIIYFLMCKLGTYNRTALKAAFLLGGAGELGFALIAVAHEATVISHYQFEILIAANLLGILLTPLLFVKEKSLVNLLLRSKAEGETDEDDEHHKLENHIIVCGCGRTGYSILSLFERLPVEFIVLEEDNFILKKMEANTNVVYGSSDRPDVLKKAGIENASALIITYPDTTVANLTIQAARRLNDKIFIIVKAKTRLQESVYLKMGANKVLLEAHESGFLLGHESLTMVSDIPEETIDEAIIESRNVIDTVGDWQVKRNSEDALQVRKAEESAE